MNEYVYVQDFGIKMDKNKCSVECLCMDYGCVYSLKSYSGGKPVLVILEPNIVPILHLSEILLINYLC